MLPTIKMSSALISLAFFSVSTQLPLSLSLFPTPLPLPLVLPPSLSWAPFTIHPRNHPFCPPPLSLHPRPFPTPSLRSKPQPPSGHPPLRNTENHYLNRTPPRKLFHARMGCPHLISLVRIILLPCLLSNPNGFRAW